MRILYDGKLYGFQKVGGVNRYFAEIISRLPASVAPVISVSDTSCVDLPEHPHLMSYRGRSQGWPRQLARWRERKSFRRIYADIEYDLVHPTYYSLLSGNSFADFNRPVVLTVYDMIHERFSTLVDRRGKNAAMKRIAINAADAIICISESTKRDLLDFYDVPEDRIAVIHLASCLKTTGLKPSGLKPSGLKPSGLKPSGAAPRFPAPAEPFFLYVGSRAAYKNFELLLDALRTITASDFDCRLFVVGPPFCKRDQVAIASRGLGKHVVHRGFASDDELASLYRTSAALVYPSRYEGFGIPLLEAMQCGTAVVAANTSSIPEVVGDAALLFDPNSAEQLAGHLRDLLSHPRRRAALIERGQRRAQQFSWQATAEATMDVYNAALAGGPVGGINHVIGEDASHSDLATGSSQCNVSHLR